MGLNDHRKMLVVKLNVGPSGALWNGDGFPFKRPDDRACPCCHVRAALMSVSFKDHDLHRFIVKRMVRLGRALPRRYGKRAGFSFGRIGDLFFIVNGRVKLEPVPTAVFLAKNGVVSVYCFRQRPEVMYQAVHLPVFLFNRDLCVKIALHVGALKRINRLLGVADDKKPGPVFPGRFKKYPLNICHCRMLVS